MSNSSFSLANKIILSSGVAAGNYGSKFNSVTLSVDATGRITVASNSPLPIGTSGSSLPLLSGANTWSGKQTFSVAPIFGDKVGSQLALGVRKKLTGPLNLYVSPSGNDSNDGLSGTTAFQTIPAAISYITQSIDISRQLVTVNIAAGTYTSGIWFYNKCLGNNGNVNTSNGIVFTGAGSSTVISTANQDAVAVYSGDSITLNNMTLQTVGTSGEHCIRAFRNSYIKIGTGITFGSSSGSHIVAHGYGLVECQSNGYTIAGGVPSEYHAYASDHGLIYLRNCPITITGTQAFSVFVNTALTGMVFLEGNTFSGSATGFRYKANYRSGIYTGGSSSTYLPGSIAGTVDSSSYYA